MRAADCASDMSKSEMSEAIEYLTSLKGGKITPGLERIFSLLELMGNPQEKVRMIHIAGTNGKGSTLTFIAEILKASGYRVGRYTSPAVVDYRERFRVGDRNISESDLIRGISLIKEKISLLQNENKELPSAFEAETALAFWFFNEKNCDFAVIETGMGGLLDATNVIEKPALSVIASISYDHMAFLGDTLEKIAGQKAGIIKSGCPIVSALQHKEAADVIEKTAQEKGSELTVVSEDLINDRSGTSKMLNQTFDYKGYKKLKISLLGKYQLKNAALAIEAVDALKREGIKIKESAVYEGLEKADIFGRFQMISKRPCVIIDGAHNEEAAERLSESIDRYFPDRRLIFIMGMLGDKEVDKVCEIMAGKAEFIFTVTPGNPRAMNAIELAGIAGRFNRNVTSSDSTAEAFEMASLMAGRDGVIICFGSLSFLAKMKEDVDNTHK